MITTVTKEDLVPLLVLFKPNKIMLYPIQKQLKKYKRETISFYTQKPCIIKLDFDSKIST